MQPHDDQLIGDRIKKIRSAWGLSQTEIGKICGVGKNTVSHWENGRQKPTIAQMYPVCQELDLTLDWIYLGRESGLSVAVARRLGLVENRSV
ncbi:helix-turn-helix domain-containing protein [Roseovarius sp. SYSU LYC5161]|uniref:helix-turn-helix domain-containing protein n=1 Tax=Roseovarius halophilus (ex Wu et al. 2025) TaxID=3376060 RepID=UPI0039997E86